MKKLIVLTCICIGFVTLTHAQEKKERSNKTQTDKGKFFVNTTFGAFNDVKRFGSTRLGSFGKDDLNLGLSGGYFIKKDLALITGFKIRDNSYINEIAFEVGAKKYFKNNIFVSADVGGIMNSYNQILNRPKPADYNAFKAGVNVGYAWFIGKYLAIEPNIRYQSEFSNAVGVESFIDLNLGFSIHF